MLQAAQMSRRQEAAPGHSERCNVRRATKQARRSERHRRRWKTYRRAMESTGEAVACSAKVVREIQSSKRAPYQEGRGPATISPNPLVQRSVLPILRNNLRQSVHCLPLGEAAYLELRSSSRSLLLNMVR